MLADLLLLLDLLVARRETTARGCCAHLLLQRSASVQLEGARMSCVHLELAPAAAVRIEVLPAIEIEPSPAAHVELVELPGCRCVIEEEEC